MMLDVALPICTELYMLESESVLIPVSGLIAPESLVKYQRVLPVTPTVIFFIAMALAHLSGRS